MTRIRKITIYLCLYILTLSIVWSVFEYAPHGNNAFPLLRIVIIFFATVLLTKYFLYMLLAPWHEVVKRHTHARFRKASTAHTPLVSVIIPAWNEEVGIVNTVNTVLANEYGNLEVIVVNDGSTDNSDAIMRNFAASYERSASENTKTLKYFYKENGGKGRALNYGIARSQGEIIISIDADCALTPSTVENFVKCFECPQVMAAVGNVRIGNASTVLGTIQYLEFLFSFYFKKTESLLNTIYIIGGAAGAFRREVFNRVGVYNHKNITEDIELSVRIQDEGMRIVYASDALVYTEGATSFSSLLKQRLRWKRGRFQTFRDHRHLFFSIRHKHNKVLTCVILPLALFGELQLFFEPYFVAFLYLYAYITHDFSSFISGIVVVGAMFFVQMLFDDLSTNKRASFYLLAPIGWLLFYVSTVVEYNALIKSLWGSLRRQELVWQKWERKGVLDSVISS